jgi:hypothetical protein
MIGYVIGKNNYYPDKIQIKREIMGRAGERML